MRIDLDGVALEASCGESLLTLLTRAGLNADTLTQKPLAARIGGEIYNLNVEPIVSDEGGPRMRRSVKHAEGHIQLLRYKDDLGRRVYERTLMYVLLLALHRRMPHARVLVRYSLGPGVYITIDKSPALNADDVAVLAEECRNIIAQDIPLRRERLDIAHAINFYRKQGLLDKARLLEWRKFNYYDCYRSDDFLEYFYGEMAPSTGYASVFDLEFHAPGLMLLMPDQNDPTKPGVYTLSPKLASVFAQSDEWAKLLHCDNVMDLNDATTSGNIRELIRINEALHEKGYSRIADSIVQRGARAVMVAGPSSSGKTTSANRLYTHLRVLGKNPVLLSLDNYYIDRDLVPVDENGERDLEHIETLDIQRFNDDLASLIAGNEVEVPIFDFKTGRRAPHGKCIRVGVDEPLIVEGIHGLNQRMLNPAIPAQSVFRIYVSALTTMNLDDHNRIRTTDVRLLRRMVRDYETRGASVEHTLSMWNSVQRGEQAWIFPFQEQADALFNTTLVYELAVLKKHIFPLLLEVKSESPYYAAACSIIKVLNYIQDADVEDEIPPTSILREFIGGNAFYRNGH